MPLVWETRDGQRANAPALPGEVGLSGGHAWPLTWQNGVAQALCRGRPWLRGHGQEGTELVFSNRLPSGRTTRRWCLSDGDGEHRSERRRRAAHVAGLDREPAPVCGRCWDEVALSPGVPLAITRHPPAVTLGGRLGESNSREPSWQQGDNFKEAGGLDLRFAAARSPSGGDFMIGG